MDHINLYEKFGFYGLEAEPGSSLAYCEEGNAGRAAAGAGGGLLGTSPFRLLYGTHGRGVGGNGEASPEMCCSGAQPNGGYSPSASACHQAAALAASSNNDVLFVSHHLHPSPHLQQHHHHHHNHLEPERPARLDMLLDMPPVGEDVQKAHGWNQQDRSLNLFVVEGDTRIVHRHPVAQSTDCIRGLVGYSSGIHIWEITWPLRQRGTHAIVGVATKEASLHSNGYSPLVGSTTDSWGWDLGRNMLYHNLASEENERSHRETNKYGHMYAHQFCHDAHFVVPEKFMVVLDMDKGTLAFMANGAYLGTAFSGLRGQVLHPIISSVWGHSEITMRYINGMKRKLLAFSF